jgi:CRP-like cAMP-binding protein
VKTDRQEASRRLARTPGLRGLSVRARGDLVARSRLRRLEKGEKLFEQGDEGRDVYVVLTGAVSLFRLDGEENPIPIALRSAGEWIGELALLDGGTRSASAVADSPVSVLEIPRRVFEGLFASNARFGLELAAAIGQRLRESDSALVETLHKRVRLLAHENQRLRRSVSRGAPGLDPDDRSVFPGSSAGAVRVRRAVSAAGRS